MKVPFLDLKASYTEIKDDLDIEIASFLKSGEYIGGSRVENFEDNFASGNYLPAETSSATLNYRVWLLDDDHIEVVKTIDTEIDYEADLLFCEGLGDVNGDGSVNVTDIISLIGHILETTLITDPILLCEADLNEDGLYNITDIVMLVNIILGE